MNIRQELLSAIEQLSDEQLSVLLDLALSLKNGKTSVQPIATSQAYQDWLSAENDIYNELEELECIRAYNAAKARDDEVIRFEDAIAGIKIDRR